MNSVQKLHQISIKPERLIIGLMSGTSLDGLDIAICRFISSGVNTRVEILHFETRVYEEEFKNQIRQVFAKRGVDLQDVCLMNAYIAQKHAGFINDTLTKLRINPANVDLIASHGQTIYHAPARQHQLAGMPNATLQIGDGDHIARLTGIITVSDFRQKHVAAGGEGAPLATYGDYVIFSEAGENRAMLNIGGIANFTYLPGSLAANEVFSTDTGPGNTLMDTFVRENFPGELYDENGEIARTGFVNESLLGALLNNNPFFNLPFPKTTGPEVFNQAYLQTALNKSGCAGLSPSDILATLNQLTCRTILKALQSLPTNKFALYTSGGGVHNTLLINRLQESLPETSIKTTESLGINPDAKEAVLFASLANECIAGQPLQLGTMPPLSMGKISLPD